MLSGKMHSLVSAKTGASPQGWKLIGSLQQTTSGTPLTLASIACALPSVTCCIPRSHDPLAEGQRRGLLWLGALRPEPADLPAGARDRERPRPSLAVCQQTERTQRCNLLLLVDKILSGHVYGCCSLSCLHVAEAEAALRTMTCWG